MFAKFGTWYEITLCWLWSQVLWASLEVSCLRSETVPARKSWKKTHSLFVAFASLKEDNFPRILCVEWHTLVESACWRMLSVTNFPVWVHGSYTSQRKSQETSKCLFHVFLLWQRGTGLWKFQSIWTLWVLTWIWELDKISIFSRWALSPGGLLTKSTHQAVFSLLTVLG